MPLNPLARMRNPLVFVLLVALAGTVGYMVTEGWGAFDAFYATILTISTVGTTSSHPLDLPGRVVTLGLVILGVGGVFYAATTFAESIIEGHLREYARSRTMTRRIESLRDHLILCNFGRTGQQVASELAENKAGLVVVENNEEVLPSLRTSGLLHLEGDPASDEVLLRAGILRARGLICAGDSDQGNVYIALTARSLNPNLYIVARAGHAGSVSKLERAGADRVVSPYRMAGHRMAEMALRPVVVDVLDNVMSANGNSLALEELAVAPGSPAQGRSLADTGILAQGALLLALRREGGELHVSPAETLLLESGDLLVALGTPPQLNAVAALL